MQLEIAKGFRQMCLLRNMKRLFIKFASQIIIAAVTVGFFLPKLLGGQMPIPTDALVGLYHPWRDIGLDGYNLGKYPVKNPLVTDPILQTYPWRKTAIDNFKNFKVPLWNPYSFSGQPLAANIQSAPFTPLNIMFLFIPFNVAWTMQIV